jgi:ketosteroid isomerase-like protein
MDPLYMSTLVDKVRDSGELFPSLFSAIARRDFDAIGPHMTDDVEFEICGFPRLNGHWKGRKDVVAAIRHNFDQVANQKPTVEMQMVTAHSAALLFTETGTFSADEAGYSVRVAMFFTLRDGLVSRVDEIAAAHP